MFKSGQLLQERYQLQQPLGRSPQARQTWLATDLAIGPQELVVVKLLVFTEMQWQDLKLFEREAQVLKNLEHPRIPRYRDYFLVEQQPHSQLCWWGLVQDHVPGQSLQELLEQGTRWSEQEVRQIAEDLLQILIYLHGLTPPVLHRDVKPSNLIYHNRQIWLIDFGAVQDQTTVTGMSFTVVGTVGYAPLEQFWGRAVPASDLYALGATCAHLLTGTAPCDLPQRDLRIYFRDRISFYSDFVGWIEKLTEPALEKRFGNVQEAYEALKLGKHSGITPVRGSIQTVSSTQSKKIQRIRPCIVKENSPQVLKIKVRESSVSTNNRSFLFMFYFAWGLITCICMPFTGVAFAFIFAFILAYLISIGRALWEANRRNPENANAIQFDRAQDRFEVTTRSFFSAKRESGIISAIRYLSITSSEVAATQYSSSYTVWAVTIRANRNYVVNWSLTEEEYIWLVNEVQTWLNAKK